VSSTGDNISNRQTCRTVGLTDSACDINYRLAASGRGGNVHQK
jgi:hypothetical protein